MARSIDLSEVTDSGKENRRRTRTPGAKGEEESFMAQLPPSPPTSPRVKRPEREQQKASERSSTEMRAELQKYMEEMRNKSEVVFPDNFDTVVEERTKSESKRTWKGLLRDGANSVN